MSNYFTLTLDTTAPANPSISINSGAQYANQVLVTCTIGTSDGTTTGYQMKIWGNVDPAHNVNIQATEVGSNWITYNTSQQVQLATGDGNKTLYVKIRDDVHNASSEASDSIILNTTMPVVTISGPDVFRVSKIAGKNVASFSFQVDQLFDEYMVKVVSSTGSAHSTGTVIATANGSTNMTGNAGDYPADTPINCSINGTDLELASAGDGAKIVKIFAKDPAGNWST